MLKKIDYGFLILLVTLPFVCFLVFYNLGSNYLANWDEAWYADISRNFAESGNLLTSIWNTQPFFEKPILYFWLSALTSKIIGVSEFSARFPSALASLGIAVMIYFFARELFNKTIMGILSILILFSSMDFLYRSRSGNLDILLTFFMTLSLFSFFKAISINKKWFLLFGLSLGLGFLTKGFIGLYPLIAPICFIFVWREWKVLKEKYFLLGLLITIILAGGWLTVSFAINGKLFLDQFLLANGEKFQFSMATLENFSLDYFGYLKNGLKIWFPFLMISFFYLGFKIKEKRAVLLLIYSSLFLFVMSFSNNKSSWFVLPLYPIFPLMILHVVNDLIKKIKVKKLLLTVFLVFLIMAVFQNLVYQKSFFTPDVAGDEARVALEIKRLTNKNDIIYLTNYYYPTTVYYSRRKVYALYAEQEGKRMWWIRPKTDWAKVLKKSDVTIITTKEELSNLQKDFPDYKMVVLFSSGNKLLVKKI